METDSKTARLIAIISEKNVFQAKALRGLAEKMAPEEKDGLAALLSFYTKQGDAVEHLAECYLGFIQDIMEEQLYFRENRHYRYSSSKEVNSFFYQNTGYMEYYMKGLAISTYLLESHRKCREWFCEKISGFGRGKYWLDAGVGHGEYLQLAVCHTDYEHYLGIDISPTCVQMCKEMMAQRVPKGAKNIDIREQDFFQYGGPVCDAVILGEILEHVEAPRAFLQKLAEITHEESFIYITTVVNCPQKDHIYLFKNVEEIEGMYEEAGFAICDRLICPTNGYTIEKALKKQTAILTAHIIKKQQGGRTARKSPPGG